MIIKLTEQADKLTEPTRWSLWVTETDEPSATPIYAAWSRTAEQIQALIKVILGETPGAALADVNVLSTRSTAKPMSVNKIGKIGMGQALQAMLHVLDGYIEDAQINHRSMEHRHENTGEECWRSWAPSDIRDMVNDVARGLGIAEHPAPTQPREDM